jgi:hypothetical protein
MLDLAELPIIWTPRRTPCRAVTEASQGARGYRAEDCETKPNGRILAVAMESLS